MRNQTIAFVAPGVAEVISEEVREVTADEVMVKLVISTISSGTERANLIGEKNVRHPECAVFHPAVVLAAISCVLLENNGNNAKQVISEYKPIFSSIVEYCEEMDKIYGVKKAVEYKEDGSVIITVY